MSLQGDTTRARLAYHGFASPTFWVISLRAFTNCIGPDRVNFILASLTTESVQAE